MKNRLLHFVLFILTIGFAVIFISAALIDEGKKPTSTKTPLQYLSMLKANQGTGQINLSDVLLARQQVAGNAMNNPGRSFEFNWKERGPNNLGGRTRALLFDNQDETGNTVFAGSVMGGLFKSDDMSDNWYKINENNANLHVSCLTQTASGVIYAGTGEGFTVEEYILLGDWGYSGGFIGSGIWKSTDGQTFTQLASTQPGEEDWVFVNELAADIERVFTSTNTGLKYSTDGGNTWQLTMTNLGEELSANSQDVKIGPDGSIVTVVDNLCYVSPDGNASNFVLHSTDSTYDLPNDGVGRIEFAIAPTDPNIIYAVVVSRQGALFNVYRSNDKGFTWYIIGPGGSSNFNIFNTGSNTSDGVGLYSCAIQVFPNDPDRILLGGIDTWEGTKVDEEGLFNWALRSRSTNINWLQTQFLFEGQHAYLFKPDNNNTFLVGTNGGISAGTMSGTDIEFNLKNKNYLGSQFYTVTYTATDDIIGGGAQDVGSIVNGFSFTSDPDRGWDIWVTPFLFTDGKTGGYINYSIIYPSAVMYSRTPHPAKDGNIETFVRRNEYGGFPDWSPNMFDDQYSSNLFLSPFALWESFDDPVSGDSAEFIPPTDIAVGETWWVASSTMGRPFQHTFTEPATELDTVLVYDPISSKFFIGGEDQVLMTKDVLRFNVDPEWFVISDKDHSGIEGKPQSMAYSSDANFLFVGTQEGKLYRMSNIASAWDYDRADVKSPYCIISTYRIPVYLPGTSDEITQVITSVAVDPNNADRVVITLANYGNEHYVYMTDNALSDNPEFHSIMGDPENGGLPRMPAYASLIEMDPNNNLVIIGTEYGIYVSENAGSGSPVWTSQNGGFGKVPVMMLKQQTLRKANDTIFISGGDDEIWYGVDNYGVIYGATYGRGLMSLNEFQKPVGINELFPGLANQADFELYPNPAGDQVVVSLENESTVSVTFNIYNLNGQLIKQADQGSMPKGKHEIRVNCSDLTTGTYIFQVIRGKSGSSSKLIIF